MRAAIITVSTSVVAGRREDLSGRALAERAQAAGAEVVAREVVPDDRAAIEGALRRHSAPQARTSSETALSKAKLVVDPVSADLPATKLGLSTAMLASLMTEAIPPICEITR